MKKIIIILFILLSALLAIHSFEMTPGDSLQITVITENGGFSYKTSINSNWNIMLYKPASGFSSSSFIDTSFVVFEILNVKDIPYQSYNEKVSQRYSDIVKVKQVDVSIIISSIFVYIEYGDTAIALPFSDNKTYEYYLSTSPFGHKSLSDSIFVRGRDGINKKSINQTAYKSDEILIEPDLIYVTGSVEGNKYFHYIPTMTAYDYIAKSGGVSKDGTYWGAKVISKNGKVKKLNDKLQPGDRIWVPVNMFYYLRDFSFIFSAVTNVLILLISRGLIFNW